MQVPGGRINLKDVYKRQEPLSGLIIDGKLHSGERVIVEPDGEKEVILRVA